MLIIERVNEKCLDFQMSGKLDTEGMRKALDEMVEKSQGIEDGQMLFDIVEYQLPSVGAIGLELSRLFPLLKWMRQFKRCAVLADKTWLKKVSEIEGALIPGIEIKGFDRDQRAAAEAWLAG
ncbi:hypothetical protein Rhal01_02067 [Rubritalea halochordaticola]|uniref:STAS/SEC14 domain-containing protein n=1 Tax=Rubritalea halochordaticola TaxID=714537 RepID=A0ABP9UZL2_9BACT